MLGHDFQNAIEVNHHREGHACSLQDLLMIVILQFFEYDEDLSSQLIQRVKQCVHVLLSYFISGFQQLLTYLSKDVVRVCVLNADLGVLQGDLFEAAGFTETQEVLRY